MPFVFKAIAGQSSSWGRVSDEKENQLREPKYGWASKLALCAKHAFRGMDVQVRLGQQTLEFSSSNSRSRLASRATMPAYLVRNL